MSLSNIAKMAYEGSKHLFQNKNTVRKTSGWIFKSTTESVEYTTTAGSVIKGALVCTGGVVVANETLGGVAKGWSAMKGLRNAPPVAKDKTKGKEKPVEEVEEVEDKAN